MTLEQKVDYIMDHYIVQYEDDGDGDISKRHTFFIMKKSPDKKYYFEYQINNISEEYQKDLISFHSFLIEESRKVLIDKIIE